MLACVPVAAGLTETRRRGTRDGFVRWESHRLQHHELRLAQPRQPFDRKGLGRLPTRRLLTCVSTSADADGADQRAANVGCRACIEPLERFARALSRRVPQDHREDCDDHDARSRFHDRDFGLACAVSVGAEVERHRPHLHAVRRGGARATRDAISFVVVHHARPRPRTISVGNHQRDHRGRFDYRWIAVGRVRSRGWLCGF